MNTVSKYRAFSASGNKKKSDQEKSDPQRKSEKSKKRSGENPRRKAENYTLGAVKIPKTCFGGAENPIFSAAPSAPRCFPRQKKSYVKPRVHNGPSECLRPPSPDPSLTWTLNRCLS